jgi:hypothetical protein
MVLFWTIFWRHASYSKNKCHTKDLNLRVEKTVDTHKILINAIKCYVCLQEI